MRIHKIGQLHDSDVPHLPYEHRAENISLPGRPYHISRAPTNGATSSSHEGSEQTVYNGAGSYDPDMQYTRWSVFTMMWEGLRTQAMICELPLAFIIFIIVYTEWSRFPFFESQQLGFWNTSEQSYLSPRYFSCTKSSSLSKAIQSMKQNLPILVTPS